MANSNTFFVFQFGGEVAGFGSNLLEAVEHAQSMGFNVKYEELEMFGTYGLRIEGKMYWTNDTNIIDELELEEF